jgi:hypothetical protein
MNTFAKWQQSFLKTIQLQLFISCISLPFLIAWGLPVSVMSPISTIIFGPFLSCFLLISSLIFFSELLYLPNATLIWCLEKVTAIWHTCLGLEQRAWLIGFPKPPLAIIFLIPLIAFAIIHSKKIITITHRISILAFFLVATCIALKFFPYRARTHAITCNTGEITIINKSDACIMIDPGYLASRTSYESFIAYTLVPEIIQKTGNMHLDHVIISKFNKRILDALQFLATKIRIKNLYLPWWNGRIPSFAWKSYAQLKKIMTENNGKIHGISYKKQIYKNETETLFVEPAQEKPIAYYDATYIPLTIKKHTEAS